MHRYHRPAALVANALSGGSITAKLNWLQPQPFLGSFVDSDLNTFTALGVIPPRG